MRWILRVFFGLVVLVLLMVAALFALPGERIAALVSDQVKSATGREMSLEGRLKPSIWPQIGLQAGPVALSNADWASDTPMLQAQSLLIGLDPSALIGGDIVIRELRVDAPQIVLETNAQGQGNWEFGGDSSAGGSATPFTLDQARITDGTLIYRAGGVEQRVEALDATLSVPSFDGPAQLQLSTLLNGQKAALDLDIASFSAALAGQVSALNLTAQIAGADLSFDGRAGHAPLAADGALSLQAADLGPVLAALGQSAELPPELRGLSVTGQITLAPEGTLHLRDGRINVAGNSLAGALDIDLNGTRPALNGQLSTGTLDLTALASEEASGGGSGWSKTPIDVSALGALDASLAFSAEAVKLPGLSLNKTRLLATLNDRRLVFDLRELRAHQGLTTGEFVINGRGGLSVGGDLKLEGLALEPALSELADYQRLSGTGNAQIKFLASGNSQAALANSLSGSGAISFSNGVLQGVDLASAYRREQGQNSGRTVFDKITASFEINKGVLNNQDFVFDSARLKATGKGQVGIGARNLDYRMVPVAFARDDEERSLKVPLRISGSWSSPKLALDLESLVEERIEKEREKRKEEFEQKLEERKQELREDIREKLREKLLKR